MSPLIERLHRPRVISHAYNHPTNHAVPDLHDRVEINGNRFYPAAVITSNAGAALSPSPARNQSMVACSP